MGDSPRPDQLYVAAINVQSLKPHLLEFLTAYNALPQSIRDMGPPPPRRFRPELREHLLTKQSGTDNDKM